VDGPQCCFVHRVGGTRLIAFFLSFLIHLKDLHNLREEDVSAVCMAGGVKCAEGSFEKQENILRDCHAESLAHRSLLLFLLSEISQLIKETKGSHDGEGFRESPNELKLGEGLRGGVDVRRLGAKRTRRNVFEISAAGKVSLRSNVAFHLFVSQSPCGDASVFPISRQEFSNLKYRLKSCSRKRKRESLSSPTAPSLPSLSSPALSLAPSSSSSSSSEPIFDDTNRTGAHLIRELHEGEREYDVYGAVRLKPGRIGGKTGLRARVVSCSDKISKWIALGFQSSLLACILPPLYFSSIIVSDSFNADAMKRCFWERMHKASLADDQVRLQQQLPALLHSRFIFEKGRKELEQVREGDVIPANLAFAWFEGGEEETLIGSRGVKMGAKKNLGEEEMEKYLSLLCTANMKEEVSEVIQLLRECGGNGRISKEEADEERKLGMENYKSLKEKFWSSEVFYDWMVLKKK
jgi:hypothetical protein